MVSGVVVCLYLSFSIFSTNVEYQNIKKQFNIKYFSNAKSLDLNLSIQPKKFLRYPAKVELYLRSQLLEGGLSESKKRNLQSHYLQLLKTKPTWPYYFSGMAQLNASVGGFEENMVKAIGYGAHESKVLKSVSDIFFSRWNDVTKVTKGKVLNYLVKQDEYKLMIATKIAAKFARMYEICDYIYMNDQVENEYCLSQYWLPLTDIQ